MDRFVRGFIIGVVATIIKDVLNLFSYSVLHFAKNTYAQFMGIILLGYVPRTTTEIVYAELMDIAFNGLIGVVFIYYAYRTHNKKNLWLKGIFFGEGLYIGIYSIGTFFGLPILSHVPIETAISNFITSGIDGFLIGIGVYWWGKRIGDFDGEKPQKIKTAKYTFAPQPARKVKERKRVRLRKPYKIK